MTTQTNQQTCSEQIAQIRDVEPFASVGQFNEAKIARGWNLVLAPFVRLLREYVRENDAKIAALEARIAALESTPTSPPQSQAKKTKAE